MKSATKIKSSRVYKTHSPKVWEKETWISSLPESFVKSKTTGQELGSGGFGIVYQGLEKDKVLKICRFEPLGYTEFVKAVYKNTEYNPHLPNFHEIDVFRFDDGAKYLAIEMEKLSSLSDEECPLYDEAFRIVDLFRWNKNLAADYDTYIKRYPMFLKTREFLKKTYQDAENRGIAMIDDLCLSNVMARDNVPVVTDPFA